MLVTQNPSFPWRGQSFGQCDSARHKKARASFRAFRFTSDGANGDGGARRGRRRDRDRNRPRLGHRKLDRSNRSIEVRNTVTTCHKRRPRDQKRVLGRSRAASVGRASPYWRPPLPWLQDCQGLHFGGCRPGLLAHRSRFSMTFSWLGRVAGF
jgi:hypothetical protein